MEKVRKYGGAVSKLYREEGPASTKAAAYRAKIRETIDTLDAADRTIDREELLECMWQLAYYPAARSGQMDDYLRMVLSLLAGELQLMRPAQPGACCSIYVYVGDLHRYQQTPLALRLARLYYARASLEDPAAARPFNQLSITMDPLPAVRCLLQAAATCAKPFKATEKNLEGRLIKMKQQSAGSLKVLATILQAALAEKKLEEEELPTALREWTTGMREWAERIEKEKRSAGKGVSVQKASGDAKVDQKEEVDKAAEDWLLQLHCLSLAAGACHVSNSPLLIDTIQSTLLALLEMKKEAEEEEEEEQLVVGSRRRRASGSDEEEEERAVRRKPRRRGSDSEEEAAAAPAAPAAGPAPSAPPTSTAQLVLVLALEWIARVDQARIEGASRYAPARRVMKEKMKFEQIVSAVLPRLSKIEGLAGRVEELSGDPTARSRALVQWRMVERLQPLLQQQQQAPPPSGKQQPPPAAAAASEWTALWLATIVREEEGSIQQASSSAGAFEARNDLSLRRKMAELHAHSQQAAGKTAVRPVSVVLQAAVLERRLGKIRALAERSHLVWYVPASELARLDATKGGSKAARDALRFIETQQHTRVRVLPAGGIAEALARATAEAAPVALLSLDTVKDAETLPIGSAQCLHVDSFAHSYK